MITTANLGIRFSGKALFESVNVKFTPGECYGVIGSNGAGKSTFLKILSGQIEDYEGDVILDKSARISTLSQNQFEFDDFSVFDTVMKGHDALYKVYKERLELYAKAELTDKEGEKVGLLEERYDELGGYIAEADAASLLDDLGISADKHELKMAELEASEKVKVLLAKALFGDPDVLLMDEPTNQLDYRTVLWLEKFLLNFKNTVLVVSHDRHFLNKVCTHMADVDFGDIKLYPGNYDFWKDASELAVKQRQDKNKKNESKIKELEAFVRRFSANASKSKQATSRKNQIEKLRPEELPVSKRRSPYINFKTSQRCGTAILKVKDLSVLQEDGSPLFSNLSFTIEKDDKLAILADNDLIKTALLQVLSGEAAPDSGTITWGETISHAYFPKDNSDFFKTSKSLTEWLGQYEDTGDLETLRGYLGRMLFSGEDADKDVTVLSGGEKARAMFSRMMLTDANMLLFDEPTDHLDLESITALNTALLDFNESLIFSTHDVALLSSAANRFLYISDDQILDRRGTFDEFIAYQDSMTVVAKA